MLPEAAWQRCYVHFLRNALDYVPRKVDGDCLRELRWFYDRRDLTEARRDLAAWLTRWQAIYPKLCVWVEEHIEETLAFYRLPRPHHKHLKSTDEIDKPFVKGGPLRRERGALSDRQESGEARRAQLTRVRQVPYPCGAARVFGATAPQSADRSARPARRSPSPAF